VQIAPLLAIPVAAALLGAGCGDDDFENTARAPVRSQLSGVILKDRVAVSPSHDLGAGPYAITISNQTGQPHTVTLEGESVRQSAGTVQPQDTLTIHRTLEPGSYEVRAGSEEAQRKEIEPATLDIGADRRDSNSDLMLP